MPKLLQPVFGPVGDVRVVLNTVRDVFQVIHASSDAVLAERGTKDAAITWAIANSDQEGSR